MARRGILIAALGVGVLVLSGCRWHGAPNSFTDDAAIDAHITSVRVANDSGDVTIKAGQQPGVHRVVHYDKDKPGATHRVDGNVLVLDGCHQDNCSIDYQVIVPPGTSITGVSESGRTELDDVSSVNLSASSGDVIVHKASGSVNVDASSGSVQLSDLGGATAVQSSSGDVRVEGARADVSVDAKSGTVQVRLDVAHNVKVRASSGDVHVTVPQDRYRVTAGVDSGEVRNSVADDPQATNLLDLHSTSGDVTLAYS
jgi:hypothetical protein